MTTSPVHSEVDDSLRGGVERSGNGAMERGLATRRTPEEIVTCLLGLAKRGKLPGFTAATSGDGELFRADIHASPFDRVLGAHATRDEAAGVTRLSFRLRTLRRAPWTLAIVTALSAGPGLWLTQSMLETYFSWYKLSLLGTAAWYIPLTVGPLPLLLPGMWKRSSAAAHEHAREVIATVARALDADAM